MTTERETGDATRRTIAPMTFVIPTREEGAYIGRTLEQFVRARRDYGLDCRVIVVDGGSTDDTVTRAAAADIVVYDREDARRSIAAARNLGASLADDELVFHTDADVIFPDLPSLLEQATEAFSDGRVVAVTAPIWPYPEESRWLDLAMHRLGNWLIRNCLHTGAFLARGECQIVRQSAFQKVGGYNPAIIGGEDCDLFRRLSRIGRIVYLRNACVYHSTRRFRQVGYRSTIAMYAREAAWLIVRRRSYLSEWPVVR